MHEKFRQLIELGAGEFEHVDGTLIAHLEGTMCLLKTWHASKVLQDAGLYHAAYGTSGFAPHLFELSHREEVAMVIGSDAENIVYHYCACEREAFFAQFAQIDKPVFYDRMTNKKSTIPPELLHQLCELTAANEIEIAINNPDFVSLYGAKLRDLFNRMQMYLSPCAQRKINHVFGTDC